MSFLPLLDRVVARGAKGLPVGAVPKQVSVATVRNDVIHNGCEPSDSVLGAFAAVWMLGEVFAAGLAPLMVIATLPG